MIDIVLIRMDKIGDLVVTMPVDEHPAFAGQRVHWIVTKGLSFIGEQAVPKRSVSEYKRRFSPGDCLRLIRWFKRQNPRTVVLLHVPWWVSFAAWAAGVPERMGRLSQWHSFLFLNVGVRQSRKASDRHESDYNFDLVEAGFARLGYRATSSLAIIKRTFLRLLPPNPYGTVDGRGLKTKGYRIVHPGMGGSALNWPPENFQELVERLSKDYPVLITGTKADQKYLNRLQKVKELPNVRWLVDELKMFELLDLLSQARSVVAPSTGVLHLAASLGTPVVGIYSPRTVEHPRRWGPKGLYTAALVPVAPDTTHIDPQVMRLLTADQVLQAVNDLENGKKNNEVVPFPSA